MKFENWKIGILILLLTPLFFLNILDSHDWGDDFAQYILQAKNLAEAKPQTQGAYIFNPDYPFYAPPVYPVGYPLLLAPVYAMAGNNMVAFNYFQTLLLFLFAIAAFFLLRKFMDSIFALLLTLIAAYNPWMLDFKINIIADLPFSLFGLLSVLGYLWFREKKSWSAAVITGCCTAFAILIKPIGFVLVTAFFVDVLITHFKRRDLEREDITRHAVLLLLPVALYLLVTQLLISTSVETTGHFHNLYNTTEKWNKRFNINAEYYMLQFQELFRYTNPDWNLFIVVLKAFALTLFLLGFFGKLFRRFGVIEILTLLFLLLVLFFPNTTQGFRYLLPVLPFMLLYIYHGFQSIQLKGLNRKVVFILACLFCLFQYKTTIEKMWRQGRYTQDGPQQQAAQQAFVFIKNNTEANAVIAFIKPRALALYTNRKTLTNHPQQEVESMKRFFEQNNVTYYLLSKDMENPALELFLMAERGDVEVVWADEKFALLRKKTNPS